VILGAAAIGLVLAAWLLVSALGQFDTPLVDRLRSRDHFSLIPRWTFFAPRPGVTDYHLLYQLFRGDDELGWHEVPLADQRTLWGAVWNPQKRNKKALTDSVRAFTRMSRNIDSEEMWRLQYTIPYIAVLRYLTDITRPIDHTHLRFMILEDDGFYSDREPRLVFASAHHRAE
jgi:hypothetical protein